MSKKKTGRLTKVEKFYIENNTDKSAEDIAKDLNRSESIVTKHLNSSRDTGHIDSVKDKDSDTTIGDLMGHKESRGVTVMTPAASELADATRPSRLKNASRYDDAIHIIKQDKK
jgi:IS30 family transposase